MSENQIKAEEQKRSAKYGMLSCVAYMYRILWKYERSLVFVGLLTAPAALAASALTLYIPPLILSCLERSGNFTPIGLVILGLAAANALLSLANNFLSKKAEMAEFHVIARLQYQQQKNRLERDFFLDYDPEVKILDERGRRSIESNHTRGCPLPYGFCGYGICYTQLSSVWRRYIHAGSPDHSAACSGLRNKHSAVRMGEKTEL